MGEEKKLDKVKQHFKRNSKLYLGIGIGTGVTIVCGVVFANTSTGKNYINCFNVNWKSTFKPTTVIVTELERRGHPGYIIRCLETDKKYASQNHAAELLKINPSDLSKHLNGERDSVKGLTFERLGEAQPSPQK